MKILYVAELGNGKTCSQRLNGLIELGHEVHPITTSFFGQTSIWVRLKRRLGWPTDFNQVNSQIRYQIKENNFDILWLDKAVAVWPETLDFVKNNSDKIKIVGYSPDDMLAKHNKSRYFFESAPYYDAFFTTKSFNVEELKKVGFKIVKFIDNSFDPGTHRPISLSKEERESLGGSVGFIGSWEKQRNQSLVKVTSHGIPVVIWGDGWRVKKNISNFYLRGAARFGLEYTRLICSFDINLHFLRKINRDLQTTRSIEIPACGGFMLAERTNEHLELFKEGVESEFFGSDEELIDKIKFYLVNPKCRERIALAGRKRCLISGYSNYHRLKKMLDMLN